MIILFGSIYYTWVKDQELEASRQQLPQHSERFPMRDINESEPLVISVDRNSLDGEEMDDDDRELAEAARALGIHSNNAS